MKRLKSPPGIIPALDISLEKAVTLVEKLEQVRESITGLKISSLLTMETGLKTVSELLVSEIPLILDMQKGASDIPSIVDKQVKLAADYGIDAYIGSPLGAGRNNDPENKGTLEAFVDACNKYDVAPIIVLEMTQPGSTYFIKERGCEELAEVVCDLEVPYAVAPATRPERVQIYKEIFRNKGADIEIISPGVGPQKTGEPAKDAGEAVRAGTDHVVVGRAIYGVEDPLSTVLKINEEIQSAYKERE